ncbi:DUF2971 domain-containing protein [Paraburkholderia sp. HC6.4b]|uniref:DUF2971 domain-containing protein n=2 Tax=unclassified Paraburkholderia TaxID=2615204 RepID=UPI003906C098
MWAIYSRNWLGVRVTIRLAELQRQAEAAPELVNGKMWFGEVNYRRDADLERVAHRLMQAVGKRGADQMEAVAMAWLNKRLAFRHEDEMRVLFVRSSRAVRISSPSTFKFAVDPHALIKSIHIDPRAPKEIVETLQRDIRESLGFTGSVQQSSLLKLPARLQSLLPRDGLL